MLSTDTVANSWKQSLQVVNDEIFDFMVVKPEVDEWIEQNVYLSESTTVRPGYYSFDFTPYMRKIVRHLHPKDSVRFVAIMKDGQSGFTTALVVGGIMYIIENTPTGVLLTAADLTLGKKTIDERFDPVMRSSRKEHLIRPNVVKRTNNKTGDLSLKKEFRAGNLTVAGTGNPKTFRMFSAMIIFGDDWDTAPKELGKDGSPKMVIKTRQTSYGDKAKTFLISTPLVTQTSNIYEEYLLGTQNKWHWTCPACTDWFAVDWEHLVDEQKTGGIVWEIGEDNRLIPESVKYKCPHCAHLIDEREKYDLNLQGDWFSTVDRPEEDRYESYQKNGIYNPPGFDGWVTFVREWIAAHPIGQPVDHLKLKSFYNLRLGLPYAAMGSSPKSNALMQNTRSYLPGVVPDVTCEKDGNGKIILLSLAADINGWMNEEKEDVRLDWELLAHSSTGATYSVDHGSIGTFKRMHEWTKTEKAQNKDTEREKWTATHNVKNTIWKPFEELMRTKWVLESELIKDAKAKPIADMEGSTSGRQADITAVDVGHGSKHVLFFVELMQAQGLFCYGVKGREEQNFRKITRDTNPVKRSTERPRLQYNIEVDQMKDDLSQYMGLRVGEGGFQPGDFMNFPQPRDGKYTYNSYFIEYEGEMRTEEKKGDDVIGYKWVKKNSSVRNHFWDVRVYNLATPYIYIDLLKQSDPTSYKHLTWEEFVIMVT